MTNLVSIFGRQSDPLPQQQDRLNATQNNVINLHNEQACLAQLATPAPTKISRVTISRKRDVLEANLKYM